MNLNLIQFVAQILMFAAEARFVQCLREAMLSLSNRRM